MGLNLTPLVLRENFGKLLNGVSEEGCAALLGVLEECTLEAGQEVLDCERESNSLYMIHSGRVAIYLKAGEREIELTELGAGAWFGDASLISPGKPTANVRVAESATFLVLTNEAFDVLKEKSPGVAREILHTIIEDLAERVKFSGENILSQDESGNWRIESMLREQDRGWFGKTWKRFFGGDKE